MLAHSRCLPAILVPAILVCLALSLAASAAPRGTGAAVGDGDPPATVLVQRLDHPEPLAGRHTGTTTALDGDTAVVSAFNILSLVPGEVLVWRRDGASSWALEARLTGAHLASHFGVGLALEGDRLAVAEETAAVHVYERAGGAWTLEATFPASGSFYRMSGALDLDGDALAYGELEGGTNGRVHVVRRVAGTWTEEAELLDVREEGLGTSVALAGDLLVAGAPGASDLAVGSGAAYVYERQAGVWVETARIVEELSTADFGHFGQAVDTDGERLYLSAPWDDAVSGTVYVYTREAGAWVREAALDAPEMLTLGGTIHAEGARLFASAFDPTEPDRGVVLVFEREGTAWSRAYTLTAPEPAAVGFPGGRFAAQWPEVLAGAPREAVGNALEAGAAYVLRIDEASAFCFGDGSGAACPCGNPGGAGEGCAHSGGVGMRIAGHGLTSIAADRLALTASQCPPGNSGLFFAGTTELDPAVGLHDGLQCVGGDVRRFRGLFQTGGVAHDGGFGAQDPSGVFFVPGSTYRWQYWSRDVAAGASPCGTGANLSPGYAVTMAP